ncbi:MAG: SpoIID/LytB domain-containing protein [bacterium]
MVSLWKKFFHTIIVVVVVTGLIVSHQIRVRAESCDGQYDSGSDAYYACLGRSIGDLTTQLEAAKKASAPLESEVTRLSKQVSGIENQLKEAGVKVEALSASIGERDKKIKSQYVILTVKVRDLYKKMRFYSPLLIFASSSTAGDLTRGLAYKAVGADEDKNLIVNITTDILKLEADKQKIETDRAQLAALQKKLDTQKAFFEKEIAGAKKWQAELLGKIAALSAKQQQFIAQKLGSLNLPTSLGGGNLSCTDDRNLNPGFSNAFAFFTYGIPHRVGMSQYGAYGRAKNENQTYDQILRAYFNFNEYQDEGGTTIRVNNGNGINQGSVIWSGSLEDYVKRIYEIPTSWPMAALEAQAIAARSYALAVTNKGTDSICANQYCQVFKTDPKGGEWDSAVSNTSGKVMVAGGEIITAWYASTAGGYTFTNNDIWGGSQKSWTKRLRDTSGDVDNWGDLQAKAYDKDSPCMYAAQGWRAEYAKSAWLKSSELADIVNVLMLAKRDSSTQSHLSQVDKPNPDGVETWSLERVKSELKSRGGSPYDNVSDISISADFGVGKTTNVSVNGQTFSASEFVDYFNLRAPANIQIVGPLFNVERK